MSTIPFESNLVPPAELQQFLKNTGLAYTAETIPGPHRGAVETILHFANENIEAIKFFAGIFGAFNMWLEYQKVKLEKRKANREAELHEVEMELKRLEVLEKKAALHATLKNGDVLILTNGTPEEIARQVNQEVPALKPSQIKQVALK
ncbi:MAG: hypothetical protein IPN74_18690 [Haliscomenobacter sp.]|nr:hypothetical protein [Haliscomenobacter sp.]